MSMITNIIISTHGDQDEIDELQKVLDAWTQQKGYAKFLPYEHPTGWLEVTLFIAALHDLIEEDFDEFIKTLNIDAEVFIKGYNDDYWKVIRI